jgi:hypothetical protein
MKLNLLMIKDIYPKIMEMANLKGDPRQVKESDGISLVPVLQL